MQMASRLSLHEELCEILNTRKVYYNPPSSVKMQYPCIRYSLGGMNQNSANDKVYRYTNRYDITVIDPDPDSNIHEKILRHFPMCSFGDQYIADNLNHFTLTLYY